MKELLNAISDELSMFRLMGSTPQEAEWQLMMRVVANLEIKHDVGYPLPHISPAEKARVFNTFGIPPMMQDTTSFLRRVLAKCEAMGHNKAETLRILKDTVMPPPGYWERRGFRMQDAPSKRRRVARETMSVPPPPPAACPRPVMMEREVLPAIGAKRDEAMSMLEECNPKRLRVHVSSASGGGSIGAASASVAGSGGGGSAGALQRSSPASAASGKDLRASGPW